MANFYNSSENTLENNQRLGPVEQSEQLSKLGLFGMVLTRLGERVTKKKSLGVFATIGRAPRLFRGWLHYSATMMPFGYLSRKETESIILRVAHLRGNAYELDQHKTIAARAGLDRQTIAAIQSDSPPMDTPRQAVIMHAVDELVSNRSLSEECYRALAGALTERELVAFLMLVTNYDGLATVLETLGVPVDEDR